MHLVVGGAQGRVGVGLVVVDVPRSQVLELPLPQHASRVDVARTEAVDALNEQPAADDLRAGAVAVAGQHVLVRIAAKPQQSQGESHSLVVGLDRVGDIPVGVGPVGGPGQRSLASDDHGIVAPAPPPPCPARPARKRCCNAAASSAGTHSRPPYGRSDS